MTATCKDLNVNYNLNSTTTPTTTINNTSTTSFNYFTMSDKAIFGEIIDIKPIKWAIDNKLITDYKVLILYNTYKEIDEILNKYKIDYALDTKNIE